MLQADLLKVRKSKGRIMAVYLKDTEIADEVVRIFKSNTGKKYMKTLEKCEELEAIYDYRVVRGLRTLLERKCDFKSMSERGKDIRRFLFERGFVTSEEERRRIVQEAENIFKYAGIEELIFCDLKEEQILYHVPDIVQEELVKEYNLSLTQTLLFDANEMRFTASGNYQEIFRRIKYLGLMYELGGDEDGDEDRDEKEVKITGPASLFKKTRRYGTSFAKVLPAILKASEWRIKANIIDKQNRVYDFELSSKERELFPRRDEEITHFDSEVEENFYKDFLSFNTGWRIEREPSIVKTGSYVIIPDFGFYNGETKCYMEVVGFWTPEYLKNKIRKLKMAKERIIVAVNKNLDCEKGDFEGEVFFYSGRIPVMPIAKMLKGIEEEVIEREINGITKRDLTLQGDIISIEDLAQNLGVHRETIAHIDIPGYAILKDEIVSLDFLERVKERIGEEKGYDDAIKIIEEACLGTLALEVMGYRVEWRGLEPVSVKRKS
jgi:hypothetical protein